MPEVVSFETPAGRSDVTDFLFALHESARDKCLGLGRERDPSFAEHAERAGMPQSAVARYEKAGPTPSTQDPWTRSTHTGSRQSELAEPLTLRQAQGERLLRLRVSGSLNHPG